MGSRPEHVDAARVRGAQPLDALDGRRLPRTVRPEDAEDLALLHLEGDVRDRLEVAVALGQVLDDDDSVHPAMLSLRADERSNADLPEPDDALDGAEALVTTFASVARQ